MDVLCCTLFWVKEGNEHTTGVAVVGVSHGNVFMNRLAQLERAVHVQSLYHCDKGIFRQGKLFLRELLLDSLREGVDKTIRDKVWTSNEDELNGPINNKRTDVPAISKTCSLTICLFLAANTSWRLRDPGIRIKGWRVVQNFSSAFLLRLGST